MTKIIVEICAVIVVLVAVIYVALNYKQVAKAIFDLVSSKVKLFVAGLLLLVCTFVFKTVNRYVEKELTDVYNNGDCTMTIVRYGIGGDTVTTAITRIPTDTFGKVVEIRKHLKYLAGIPDKGGIYRVYYTVRCRLDDGRMVTDVLYEKPDGFRDGMGMVFHEVFYPEYESQIRYLSR